MRRPIGGQLQLGAARQHRGRDNDIRGPVALRLLTTHRPGLLIAGFSLAVPAPEAARETQSDAPPRDDKRS